VLAPVFKRLIEVVVEREADRTGDEGSEFVCGVTDVEEGGFWKSLRMSTLVGVGVGEGEGVGTSGFEVDDSDLDLSPLALTNIVAELSFIDPKVTESRTK